jgi:hypothetical protein
MAVVGIATGAAVGATATGSGWEQPASEMQNPVRRSDFFIAAILSRTK